MILWNTFSVDMAVAQSPENFNSQIFFFQFACQHVRLHQQPWCCFSWVWLVLQAGGKQSGQGWSTKLDPSSNPNAELPVPSPRLRTGAFLLCSHPLVPCRERKESPCFECPKDKEKASRRFSGVWGLRHGENKGKALSALKGTLN